MKKCTICIILILCLMVCIGGCSSSTIENVGKEIKDQVSNLQNSNNEYVQMVKNGYNEDNPDLTFGVAFNEFFSNPTWKHFEAETGENIVEFTGDCVYRDTTVKARLQFILSEDSDTFEIGALSFNEVPQIELIKISLLAAVFGNDDENDIDWGDTVDDVDSQAAAEIEQNLQITEKAEPTTIPVTTTVAPTTTVEPIEAKLSGYHIQSYANGDQYSGNFVNGVRSGQGTYTWADGIVYTGEFVNGNPSGNGTYTYPSKYLNITGYEVWSQGNISASLYIYYQQNGVEKVNDEAMCYAINGIFDIDGDGVNEIVLYDRVDSPSSSHPAYAVIYNIDLNGNLINTSDLYPEYYDYELNKQREFLNDDYEDEDYIQYLVQLCVVYTLDDIVNEIIKPTLFVERIYYYYDKIIYSEYEDDDYGVYDSKDYNQSSNSLLDSMLDDYVNEWASIFDGILGNNNSSGSEEGYSKDGYFLSVGQWIIYDITNPTYLGQITKINQFNKNVVDVSWTHILSGNKWISLDEKGKGTNGITYSQSRTNLNANNLIADIERFAKSHNSPLP